MTTSMPGDCTARGAGRLFGPAVCSSVVLLGLLCWALARMSIDRTGTTHAAAANLHALWPYWAAAGALWLALSLMWAQMSRTPERLSRRARRAVLIMGVAIVARAAVLTTHEPALSDDVYRYVFDGRNLAHGLNPYVTDPAQRLVALEAGAAPNWPGEQNLLGLLAFPSVTTPYLPLSQYVFAALGWVCERTGCVQPASSTRVFRAGFVVFEILLMAALLLALRRRGLSMWWLALYAWHPLPITEIAGSGHQDVIGVTLMTLALVLVLRPHADGGGWRDIVWSSLLAGAVMIKPVAGLAGLMAVRRRRLGIWINCLIVGAIVWFTLAMPLRWLPSQAPFAAWRTTADWMAEKSAHFGGLYEPVLCAVRHIMPDGPQREPGFNLKQEWMARRVCMVILAGGLIVVWLRCRDPWRATACGLLLLALCSTVCFPWYLMWGFALFAMGGAGGTAMWVFSLTVGWGYAVFVTGKGRALGVEWTVAPWVIAIAYIPVVAALAVDAFHGSRRSRDERRLRDQSPNLLTSKL